MEEKTQVIEVNNGEELVDALKYISSTILSESYETLKQGILPKKEEFATTEEYELAHNKSSLELINEIESIKKDVFTSVLDIYNNFLSEKAETERLYKLQKEESYKLIEYTSHHMKRLCIFTVGESLILPVYTPVFIIINGPRVVLDYVVKKKNEKIIEIGGILIEEYKNIQYPLYEFLDTLRSDYHKSKRELEEIKTKSLEGKEIEKDLLPIINPERINLPIIESKSIPAEHQEDKPIQYINKNKK